MSQSLTILITSLTFAGLNDVNLFPLTFALPLNLTYLRAFPELD